MYMLHRDIQNLDIIYFGFKSLIHNYILLLTFNCTFKLFNENIQVTECNSKLFNKGTSDLFTFWSFRQSLDKVFCHLTIITSNQIHCLGIYFQRIIVPSYCSPSKCLTLLTKHTVYHEKRLYSSAALL